MASSLSVIQSGANWSTSSLISKVVHLLLRSPEEAKDKFDSWTASNSLSESEVTSGVSPTLTTT